MTRWTNGILIGAAVGGMAFLLAILLTGPGHGSGIPAVVLFPFITLVSAFVDVGPVVPVGVALLQYPVYGAVTGLLKSRRRGIALAIAIHMMAAALALYDRGLMTF